MKRGTEEKVLEYTVVLHEDEEGGYWVEVPALEGCLTQGESVEEALHNAKEAIELYLEGLKELGRKAPREKGLLWGRVRVAV